ncbi:hypothetical protein D3C76_1805230 [compost metagenome]
MPVIGIAPTNNAIGTNTDSTCLNALRLTKATLRACQRTRVNTPLATLAALNSRPI